jgi:hypothetical protein
MYYSEHNFVLIYVHYLVYEGTLLVAQLVEALCYKSEGRGFNSRWCHWNFSLTQFFRPYFGPGVDSASNRNEYQEYFLGLRQSVLRADNLTTFMCRFSGHLGASNFWNPQGPVQACNGIALTFYLVQGIHKRIVRF